MRMRREQLLIRSIQFGLLAILFGAWWFVTHSNQRLLLLLPPPERVWDQMRVLWSSGQLWAAAVITVTTIVKAYAIAIVAGIVAGFLVTRSRDLVRAIEPII